MTYFIIGELSIINKTVKEIINSLEINESSISKYDLSEVSINYVIDDINTIGLFSDKKLVICYNLDLIDDDNILLKYLNNQNDNILILSQTKKPDERKKLVKELRKQTKVMDMTSIDLIDYIKEELKDYEVSNMSYLLIRDYSSNDYERIKREIDKLKMYKLEEKKITEEDIKKLIKKSFDGNIFDLQNAIYTKNKKEMFEVYYELIKNKEDEIKILSTLAGYFRLLLKIKLLLLSKKDETIISELKLHPYRFKLLKEQSFQFSKEMLLNYLKELSKTDINIKTGALDKKIAMELFLSRI